VVAGWLQYFFYFVVFDFLFFYFLEINFHSMTRPAPRNQIILRTGHTVTRHYELFLEMNALLTPKKYIF
jgi:hypothetical protein